MVQTGLNWGATLEYLQGHMDTFWLVLCLKNTNVSEPKGFFKSMRDSLHTDIKLSEVVNILHLSRLVTRAADPIINIPIMILFLLSALYELMLQV